MPECCVPRARAWNAGLGLTPATLGRGVAAPTRVVPEQNCLGTTARQLLILRILVHSALGLLEARKANTPQIPLVIPPCSVPLPIISPGPPRTTSQRSRPRQAQLQCLLLLPLARGDGRHTTPFPPPRPPPNPYSTTQCPGLRQAQLRRLVLPWVGRDGGHAAPAPPHAPAPARGGPGAASAGGARRGGPGWGVHAQVRAFHCKLQYSLHVYTPKQVYGGLVCAMYVPIRNTHTHTKTTTSTHTP